MIAFRAVAASIPFAIASLFVCPPATFASLGQPPLPAAHAQVQPTQLRWQPRMSYETASLRIVGPRGFVVDRAFGSGQPLFDLASVAGGFADGQYKYELTFGLPPSDTLRAALDGRSFAADGSVGDAALRAEVAALSVTLSGSFRVAGGQIVVPSSSETPYQPVAKASAPDNPGGAVNDQVIPDDLIVQGSACVGLDCVNAEVFGFSTIKLKENNTRITFEDTSATAGFASDDWQLTANDSASGGLNKFSLENLTRATVPLAIEGAAPTNSLYVDDTGKIGLRTSTPTLDVHVKTGDTPAHRLEQDSSAGFTAQTWDIAGNEANFFVRDLTGGSRLPLRIRPGAPTSSLDIAANGFVGAGTGAPAMPLHVRRTGAGESTVLRIEQTGGATPTFWDIKNNATTGRFTISDDPGTTRVPFKIGRNAVGELLRIGVLGSNTVDINGNLVVTGTITPDYVFDADFRIESIEDHAAFMWRNRHLPAVAPAQVNEHGQGTFEVGARSQGMLEELEKAHVYIEQLNRTLAQLSRDAAAKEAALADVREELAAIRKALAR